MYRKIITVITMTCLAAGAHAQSFLHTDGYDMVNERGEKILLRGVGLGNWMLPEGYMWKFGEQGDRPRRIEKIVADNVGPEKAEQFWKAFRKNYITEADIRRIAELGFNSVRPALNSRLFITETEPRVFVDEGFELLDSLIAWCKKYRLYVIIDMHGAPGGQTGQNIDDSPANEPELFINAENQDALVKLWMEIARRYKNEPTVAAYDLLNEPLPENTGAAQKYKHLLMPLYERLIREIRRVDKRHMFTLEGYNWSNNWSEFVKSPDKNLFFQFHYYCWDRPANLNDISHFIHRRKELNTPVWVGETGEKDNTIYFATTQYFEKNNIGWSFWPWKKMDTRNSPYSVNMPKGWEAIRAYSQKEESEKVTDAWHIFEELLENIKLENCVYYPDVVNAVFRRIPLRIEAENYGHDGCGKSYLVNDTARLSRYYRKKEPVWIELIGGDSNSGQLAIVLQKGEWTAYKVNAGEDAVYPVTVRFKGPGAVRLRANGTEISGKTSGSEWAEITLDTCPFEVGVNELKVEAGEETISVDWIQIGPPER